MTVMKVIRDSNGVVINIGDWDYRRRAIVDDLTCEVSILEENPLPIGSTEVYEEVSINEDGSRTVAT